MFGDGYVHRADAKPIGAREKDALAVLDLEHPSDKSKIKAQYRELVKKYHPDVNRGNARAEETFKKITRAYHHLLAHYLEK
ncbi:DnaJ domain-containing protein, partial [Streptococcus suis]